MLVALRVICCYIFGEHWNYFQHPDRMNFLYEYTNVHSLIHDTADRRISGSGMHIKAIAFAAHRDIFVYQEIDTNESNKYHNFEDLQRACNMGLLNKIHLLFTQQLDDNDTEEIFINSFNSIGLLYTDPGTNVAHYSAVLPKYQQFSLFRPKYRGDRRAHIGDEIATDSVLEID